MSSANPEDRTPAKPALRPEARRALEEADQRRKKADKAIARRAREIDGRQGPDPTRYGDWENNGIASDF